MLGANLTINGELELKLFISAEVLTVNQQGEYKRQLYKKDSSRVGVSNVQGSKDMYIALFNIGETAHDVAIDFSALGLKEKIGVRDLSKKADLVFLRSNISKISNHMHPFYLDLQLNINRQYKLILLKLSLLFLIFISANRLHAHPPQRGPIVLTTIDTAMLAHAPAAFDQKRNNIQPGKSDSVQY